jgi:hypothetical protein
MTILWLNYSKPFADQNIDIYVSPAGTYIRNTEEKNDELHMEVVFYSVDQSKSFETVIWLIGKPDYVKQSIDERVQEHSNKMNKTEPSPYAKQYHDVAGKPVYYILESDNFYHNETGLGMGYNFYREHIGTMRYLISVKAYREGRVSI